MVGERRGRCTVESGEFVGEKKLNVCLMGSSSWSSYKSAQNALSSVEGLSRSANMVACGLINRQTTIGDPLSM
jgi:hypothetical protein